MLFRDGHKCQHCKGKSKDNILNVHHIESRKTGGDSPDNLICLCETCHKKYHQGKLELKLKRGKSFKDAAFIGIMRWSFYNRLKEIYPNVKMTYGYITKTTRIENNLSKEHRVDARCISENPLVKPLDYCYYIKQVRKHNRQIHKANILKGGKKKLNQAPYEVKGFRLFDKVKYDGKECFIFGRRSSGYFDLRKLDGEIIHRSANYKKIKLLDIRKSLLWERKVNLG
ncbi:MULTISPECIES: HNH endonuclease [unclassified Clostridium]|uniref:HNH endonuclease n=1 Tax=unclassified Clostridium TaxID=2614128 RepID=UPI0025C26D33|nr:MULTISPECIES: HNH endonuclease signature motif containing protein [unclassified Clostridium]